MTAAKHTSLIVAKAQDGTPEILVYGYINEEMAADFTKQLKALEKKHSLVNVRINSKGGSVYDGIAMFNAVRQAKCDVDMYIDGIAASMASAIPMAGRKIYMSRFGRFMTHRPGGGAFGNSEKLREAADEVDACEAILCEMYSERTGLSKEEVTAKFLNNGDKYMSAEQAKKAGLVDGIYDGVEIEEESDDDEVIYGRYQTALTAQLDDLIKNSNMSMKQLDPMIWAQICTHAGVTASTDDGAVVAAIKALKTKADKHDSLAEEVDTMKAVAVTKDVTAMLDKAKEGKKITAQQHSVFLEEYKGNPVGLKKILATMGTFTSVTTNLEQEEKGGEYSADVQAMVAKGWDKLMKDGTMAALKQKNPEAYNELYKSKFGYLPNMKPRMRK